MQGADLTLTCRLPHHRLGGDRKGIGQHRRKQEYLGDQLMRRDRLGALTRCS